MLVLKMTLDGVQAGVSVQLHYYFVPLLLAHEFLEFQRAVAAGTSEIVTPHFFLQAVAFLTAHRKKPQCIFSPRPFILVKGNLVILAIAAELVGGYDCSSRPLNATGVLLP